MGEDKSVFYYRNGTDNVAELEQRNNENGSEQHQSPKGEKPQIHMKQNNAKSGSVFTIILISILAAAILGAVIYTLDKRNTVYNKVSTLNTQLNLAEAENVRLQSELESKMSAKNVEDYAENVLGMIKINSSQIQYIKIQTDDVVSIPEQEEGIVAKIERFFKKCVEYFRG